MAIQNRVGIFFWGGGIFLMTISVQNLPVWNEVSTIYLNYKTSWFISLNAEP